LQLKENKRLENKKNVKKRKKRDQNKKYVKNVFTYMARTTNWMMTVDDVRI